MPANWYGSFESGLERARDPYASMGRGPGRGQVGAQVGGAGGGAGGGYSPDFIQQERAAGFGQLQANVTGNQEYANIIRQQMSGQLTPEAQQGIERSGELATRNVQRKMAGMDRERSLQAERDIAGETSAALSQARLGERARGIAGMERETARSTAARSELAQAHLRAQYQEGETDIGEGSPFDGSTGTKIFGRKGSGSELSKGAYPGQQVSKTTKTAPVKKSAKGQGYQGKGKPKVAPVDKRSPARRAQDLAATAPQKPGGGGLTPPGGWGGLLGGMPGLQKATRSPGYGTYLKGPPSTNPMGAALGWNQPNARSPQYDRIMDALTRSANWSMR